MKMTLLDRNLCRLSSENRSRFTGLTLIILALIVVYANSFHCSWHFDDYANIVSNENIQIKSLTWPEIKKCLFGFDDDLERISRPASFFSFALNYYFGGLEVFGFHLVNFAIHVLAAAFLFLVILKTLNLPLLQPEYGRDAHAISLLAVFIWAVNPVQVTAVTYIVQRMASMAAMFAIMAFFCYLQGRLARSRRKGAVFHGLALLLWLLAVLSKQNAFMLPAAVFVYDLFLIQGVSRKTLVRSLKILALPVLAGMALAFFYSGYADIMAVYQRRPFTLFQQVLTQPRILLYYLSLLFYPMNFRLALLHDLEMSQGLLIPWTTLPAILACGAAVLGSFLLSRKTPLLSFCLLFFFINHGVESSFLPLEPIFEHRNYLPSMFIFVPAAAFVVKRFRFFEERRGIQLLLAGSLIVFLAGLGHTTHMRNQVLQTELSLYSDNVQKSPRLSIVRNNLGKYYWDRGMAEEAREEFDLAIQLDRYFNLHQRGLAYHNKAVYCRFALKDLQKALKYAEAGLEKSPWQPKIWAMVADLYFLKGNSHTAAAILEEALASWPRNADLRIIKAKLLLAQGDADGAVQALPRRYPYQDLDLVSLQILGEAYTMNGDLTRAMRCWELLASRTPGTLQPLMVLADLADRLGRDHELRVCVARMMEMKGARRFAEIFQQALSEPGAWINYRPDVERLSQIVRASLTQTARDLI